MSKYKEGDKFIIEIDDVLYIESAGGLAYEPWYLVNGMEGTYFEDDDLDSLERYDGDKGVWNAGFKTGYDKGYKDAQKVKDSQDLVKDLVKAFCEDGTWLERQGVYTLTLAEAKQRAVDIIESVLAKDEPTISKMEQVKGEQTERSE